jgi:hypothetical protein
MVLFPAGAKVLLFAPAPKPVVGRNQSSDQRVTVALATQVKRPGRESGYSFLSVVEIKKAKRCTDISHTYSWPQS